VAQYIPILLLPVSLVCTKGKFHDRVKCSILFIVFVAVAVIPWAGRNYMRYGAWALTTQLGHNMLYDNASLLESNRTHTPLAEVQGRLMGVIDRMNISNPFEKSTVQTKYAVSLMREHPIDYVLIHVRGMVNLYLSPDTRPILNLMGRKPSEFPDGFVITSSLRTKMQAFFKYKSSLEIFMGLFLILLWIVVYLCTIGGFIGLFREREWAVFIVLLGTVVYFTIIVGPIGYSRLKLPIIPVYSVVAAYFLLLPQSRLGPFER